MATIRIKDLPVDLIPSASDVVALDNATTRKATIIDVCNAAVPVASNAEATAGVDHSKRMTAASTAHAIATRGAGLFASQAQGALADTAVQPADLALVATSGNYNDLANKPDIPDIDGLVPNTRAIAVGDGLIGGGNLKGDRMISLSPGALASLALADTAVQPGALTGYVGISTNVSAGAGLTGGGPLTGNVTISLSSGSQASLALANTAVQPDVLTSYARNYTTVAAGAGLIGGGDLSANRTLSLSPETSASLSLVSTAVQPADLGPLATKSKILVSDIEATGSLVGSNFLSGDGSWKSVGGGGDLLAAHNLSDLSNVATARTNLELGSVNNTSDVDKPISAATQTELNLKAPLASPALTGTPTAPTALPGTSTTQIASTAFVTSALPSAASASDIFLGADNSKYVTSQAIADANGIVMLDATGATVDPDLSLGLNFLLSLPGNRTLANPVHMRVGQSGSIWLTRSAASATLSFDTNWKPAGNTFSISTATTDADLITFFVVAQNAIVFNVLNGFKP